MNKKNLLQIIVLLLALSVSVTAQKTTEGKTTVDSKTVAEKYEEVSKLKKRTERQEFIRQQTPEMLVALWNLHFDRKLKEMELTDAQKRHVEKIRLLVTVEFIIEAKGSQPYEKAAFVEFNNAMMEAFQLFTKQQINELFYILGDSKTLEKQETVSTSSQSNLRPLCNCSNGSMCDGSCCAGSNCQANDAGCGCLGFWKCNKAMICVQ